jgi:hypothetical protein
VATFHDRRDPAPKPVSRAGLLCYTSLTRRVNEGFDLIQKTGLDADQAKQVHWRIPVLNEANVHDPAVHSMFDVDDKHSRERDYNLMMEAVNSEHPLSLQPTDVSSVRYSNTFLLNARDFPNWFTTSTGLVCRSYAVPQQELVPRSSMAPRHLFLLHPLDNGMYKFVGEAYVHGTMQGEALLDKSKGRCASKVLTWSNKSIPVPLTGKHGLPNLILACSCRRKQFITARQRQAKRRGKRHIS